MIDICNMCPKAEFHSIGICHHYRFHINTRGLANVQPSLYSNVSGCIWKLNQNDHDRLISWANEYFPKITKVNKTVNLLPFPQNENIHTSKKTHQTDCEVFFFRSISTQSGQASLQYIDSLVKQLQSLGIPHDYILELRLWISIL